MVTVWVSPMVGRRYVTASGRVGRVVLGGSVALSGTSWYEPWLVGSAYRPAPSRRAPYSEAMDVFRSEVAEFRPRRAPRHRAELTDGEVAA